VTESDRGNQNEHLEPTIVPVRRPQADAAPAREPRRAAAHWRGPLVGIAALLAFAGVVAVFFFLPSWVERAEPVAEPEPEPVEAIEPEPLVPPLTDEERAELRARAESMLAELLEQRQELDARSAASWGDTTWSAYDEAARLADDALLEDDVREAVNQYERALAAGRELLERSEQIMAEALAAGDEALVAGNQTLAVNQFELVLAVDPDNARAERGLARARELPGVLEAMRAGDDARDAGDLAEAAEAYRAALAIDPNWTAAQTALNQVTARLADIRFDSLISQGYAAIDDGSYERAMELFNEAATMRPGSAEARDGLAQAEQSELMNQILMAEVRGIAFERRELWDRAIERYREALAADPTLQFAIDGLARAQQRADLDAKLENLIENPRLLLADDVFTDAEELLTEAAAIAEPGPRITGQIEQLGELMALASTPLPVSFVSDGQTEVELYRVGNLGTFMSKELELKPGTYTAVGMRRGYRDVRERFEVLPGRELGPVTVICVEPI
jgi:tetratricopeptide (TPR) repeat protein